MTEHVNAMVPMPDISEPALTAISANLSLTRFARLMCKPPFDPASLCKMRQRGEVRPATAARIVQGFQRAKEMADWLDAHPIKRTGRPRRPLRRDLPAEGIDGAGKAA